MDERKITTVLLGLDGVIVDTESYNDTFWNQTAKDNNLKIEDFSNVVRGMTINSIIDLYFGISTIEEKNGIRRGLSSMEENIPYKDLIIPGVLEFVQYLRKKGYKLGLVTSSSTSKVGAVLKQLSLDAGVFDTIITSDSIKRGKPDPMGYVLASTNLGVNTNQCAVFEDSFTGIKAATYAFTRVIGVSTGLTEEFLKDYTYGVVPDFTDIAKLEKLLS